MLILLTISPPSDVIPFLSPMPRTDYIVSKEHISLSTRQQSRWMSFKSLPYLRGSLQLQVHSRHLQLHTLIGN